MITLFQVRTYRILQYKYQNNQLKLYINYTYIDWQYSYNRELISAIIYDFILDDSKKLYKLISSSNNSDLTEVLKKDNILIKQNDEYYLTNSVLLGFL